MGHIDDIRSRLLGEPVTATTPTQEGFVGPIRPPTLRTNFIGPVKPLTKQSVQTSLGAKPKIEPRPITPVRPSELTVDDVKLGLEGKDTEMRVAINRREAEAGLRGIREALRISSIPVDRDIELRKLRGETFIGQAPEGLIPKRKLQPGEERFIGPVSEQVRKRLLIEQAFPEIKFDFDKLSKEQIQSINERITESRLSGLPFSQKRFDIDKRVTGIENAIGSAVESSALQVLKAEATLIRAITEPQQAKVLEMGISTGEGATVFGKEKIFIPAEKIGETRQKILTLSKNVIANVGKAQQDLVAGVFDDVEGLNTAEEYIFVITQGAVSIAEAMAITAMTGGGAAGFAISTLILGGIESLPTFNEALDAGKTLNEARLITMTKLVGTGALESLGGAFALKSIFAGSGLTKILLRSITKGGFEVVQEEVQTVFQNSVDKIGFNPTKDIFDGMYETLIGTLPAFLLGGIGGFQNDIGVQTQIKDTRSKLNSELKKLGIKNPQQRQTIIDQMINFVSTTSDKLVNQLKSTQQGLIQKGVLTPEGNLPAFIDIGAFIPPSIKDKISGIPQELQPLAQEARKFKTPEEFVKAQPKVFHGTAGSFEQFDFALGGALTEAKSARGAVFFVDNEDIARNYSVYAAKQGPIRKTLRESREIERKAQLAQKAGQTEKSMKLFDEANNLLRKAEELDKPDVTFKRRKQANIKEVVLTGDFLEVDARGKTPQELSDEGDIDSWLNTQIQSAKQQGKDGVKFKNLDDTISLQAPPATHYAIFSNENIKTKSQLTDFFNQAKKGQRVFDAFIKPSEFLPIPKTVKEALDVKPRKATGFLPTEVLKKVGKEQNIPPVKIAKEIKRINEIILSPKKPAPNVGTIKQVINRNIGITPQKNIIIDEDGNVKEFTTRDLRRFYGEIAKQDRRFEAEEKAKPIVEFKDITKIKDIGIVAKNFEGTQRNFESVFGKDSREEAVIVAPLDKANTDFSEFIDTRLNELNDVIVLGLKIKKGSKESAAIQELGEKTRTKDSLIKQFGKERTEDIVKAERWFRKQYDELIDQINKVRKEVFPNDPTKIIKKRNDYFRHYQDLNGLGGLARLLQNPTGIDPTLVGISEFTKPNSKFLSFAQKRLGILTNVDAVGGYINYIPSASQAIHIDPQIKNIRKFRKNLAEALVEAKNQGEDIPDMANFLEFLEDQTNQLAGKTNPFGDRLLIKVFGRKPLAIVNYLGNRARSNVILGNISSLFAQPFNLPQSIAITKFDSIKALPRSFASILGGKTPADKSGFIKNRYADDIYSKFEVGFIDNSKAMAGWTLSTADKVFTRFIWESFFEMAETKGIKGEPSKILWADKLTAKMVGDRRLGKLPIAQQANFTKLVAPFTVEVGNAMNVFAKDIVGSKSLSVIITFLVASFFMNELAEKIRGSRVSFDVIDAFIDAIDIVAESNENGEILRGFLLGTGRIAGEFISNVPFGQFLAQIYPERGVKSLGLPSRKELFGEGDPTRFGTGLLLQKAFEDPLHTLMPPFGGSQFKKTIGGIQAIKKNEIQFRSGKTVAPLVTTEDWIKALIFGKWSTEEARKFFEREKDKLDATASIKRAVDRGQFKKAIEITERKTQEGILTKRQTAIRDQIRKNNEFFGAITDEENIEKISLLPDEEKETLINTYADKTQKTIRKRLELLPPKEDIQPVSVRNALIKKFRDNGFKDDVSVALADKVLKSLGQNE